MGKITCRTSVIDRYSPSSKWKPKAYNEAMVIGESEVETL